MTGLRLGLLLVVLLVGRVAAGELLHKGVRFIAEVDEPEAALGSEIRFTLSFVNETNKPVRIYLVDEPFRCLQSMLRVVRAYGGRCVSLQPPVRPHGFVVDESDFHLIPPGESFSTSQSLHLDRELFKAGEKYIVTWIYENRVTKWLGGISTVDGPTKELFGGKDIPYIWIGGSVVDVKIRVRK